MERKDLETHILVLGALHIALSALLVLIAVVVFAAVVGGGILSGDEEAIAVTSIVGSFVTGLLILLAIPGIVGGVALIKRKTWGRILVLVMGFLHLVNVPLGTLLGIYTIWILLFTDGIDDVFAKPVLEPDTRGNT